MTVVGKSRYLAGGSEAVGCHPDFDFAAWRLYHHQSYQSCPQRANSEVAVPSSSSLYCKWLVGGLGWIVKKNSRPNRKERIGEKEKEGGANMSAETYRTGRTKDPLLKGRYQDG